MNLVSASPSFLENYWNEFDVEDEDLNAIYNLLLEREVPLTTDEMASALVEHRLVLLEQQAREEQASEHLVYAPAESYEKGNVLIFPALGNIVGKVVGVRAGENPDLGAFEVIKVKMVEDGGSREFAAKLAEHKLNLPPETPSDKQSLESAKGVMQRYADIIQARLEARLSQTEDIVRIAGRWFPKALLADIHEGHLNLAEAVLDVAGGGPVAPNELLEHIELPSDVDPLLAEFSLDYAMQEDARFDEVGPAGEVLWYLQRAEPPEVLYPPPRLQYKPRPYDRSALTEPLLALEKQLEDEFGEAQGVEGADDEITLSLLFPHWRVGALPLSPRLKKLFPTAYEAPRIRFILVDGHNGDKFPGWVVRAERYVFGLDEWYRRYDVPPGGLVKVRRGETPGEVIVEAVDRRKRNDWIRTVSIYDGSQIGFTMLKHQVGAAYDDLMVVGVVDASALDEAWLRGSQQEMPFDRLVAYVFRELAKLNPQSAVHAQALYSGLNVLHRVPPGPVFAELVSRPYYEHVGDMYWRFDEPAWRQV
jgi:hypothetical protein